MTKTITEILKDKETDAGTKLVGLNEIITNIRAKCGNSDIDVEVPHINTCDGYVKLSTLNDDDKLTIIENVIRGIKNDANEAIEQNAAVKIDKYIESAIATDDILCNVTASMDSIYL